MSGERRLKLVPYAPSDYSLGEVLNQENGYTTDDPSAVGAALSLYFQWEEHRTALVLHGEGHADLCSFDYDRDERQPSELRIRFEGHFERDRYTEFKPIKFRFEVFQACYEFTIEAIAISEDPEADGWHLITQVPTKISLYKVRRLPRIQLDDKTRNVLGAAQWTPAGGAPQLIKILEMGLRGICASLERECSAQEGELIFPEGSFRVRVVRSGGGKIVLATEPRDNQEFGRYFDVYRKVAYPNLIPRSACSEADGLSLYMDTNYFGKFISKEDAAAKSEQLISTWRDISSSQHETTADYYVTEDGVTPLGASSVTCAFISDGNPVWAFHQLCAVARPELLDLTEYLYTWRAEYLAGRAEPLSAIVWYDGDSRWLERIYTKFAKQSNGETVLFSMKQKKCTFIPCSGAQFNAGTIELGSTKRHWVETELTIAGAGPRYLNASALLDSIIVLDEQCQSDEVHQAGSAILSQANSSSTLEVTYPSSLGDEFIDGERIEGSDRFIKIPKADLVSFIYSVWHSIAVTKKKVKFA